MSSGKGICAVVPLKDTERGQAAPCRRARRRAAPATGARHVRAGAGNARRHARACRHPGGDRSIPPAAPSPPAMARRFRHEARARRTYRRGRGGGTAPGDRKASACSRCPAISRSCGARTSGSCLPPIAGRARSRSCPRTTGAAPMPCSARRPPRCRCVSATTASFPISPPPALAGSSRGWLTCRASRSTSIRPTTSRSCSRRVRPHRSTRCCDNGMSIATAVEINAHDHIRNALRLMLPPSA